MLPGPVLLESILKFAGTPGCTFPFSTPGPYAFTLDASAGPSPFPPYKLTTNLDQYFNKKSTEIITFEWDFFFAVILAGNENLFKIFLAGNYIESKALTFDFSILRFLSQIRRSHRQKICIEEDFP